MDKFTAKGMHSGTAHRVLELAGNLPAGHRLQALPASEPALDDAL